MRGSVLKALLGDRTSPVLYGYDQNALAVYFNQAPVMRVGGAAAGLGGGRGGPNLPGIPNMQPNAVPPRLTTLDGPSSAPPPGAGARTRRPGWAWRSTGRRAAEPGEDAPASRRPRWRTRRRAAPNPATLPRVLLSFPTDPNDLLLVGTAGRRRGPRRPRRRDRLAGGQGARGDVRQPPLLALADAGQLLPGFQRDPELERSGRRESPREGGDGAQ